MKLYDFGLTIIYSLIIVVCCMYPTRHNLGYDDYITAKDLEAVPIMYYSIPGVEDKIWWELSSVKERSALLADHLGYTGEYVGCSADGRDLYILERKEI